MQPTPNPSFSEPSGAASFGEATALHRYQDAAEGARAFVANGIAASAARQEPDPDWQPL